MADFSRLQAVMYTVKVAASQKWCKVDTLLLHTSNRKCHMAYWFVPFPMTLNDLEGYSPKRLFKCNSQTFVQHFARFRLSALRAPSANADLLVVHVVRDWAVLLWLHCYTLCTLPQPVSWTTSYFHIIGHMQACRTLATIATTLRRRAQANNSPATLYWLRRVKFQWDYVIKQNANFDKCRGAQKVARV